MNLTKEFTETIFLESLQKSRALVHIYLISGIKLKGVIVKQDAVAIFLESIFNPMTHVSEVEKSSLPQMIYKNAISTILPSDESVL